MIRLNVFVQVEADKLEEAISAAKELTACSLKETGCVAYDTFRSETRPDVFMICETWADQAVLDAHSASDHFKKYVGVLESLGKMKLERFEF